MNPDRAANKRVMTVLALFVIAAGGLFIYNLDALISFMKGITAWLIETIGQLGYAGIVGLMFVESSFIPFPSEVVLPPAGYLAWKGEMSFTLVVISGLTGSMLGALFNYWFAFRLRPFLIKWGKYFLISPESLEKVDTFFLRHGHISTLIGRLLPVIRQLVSLPAGLARMRLGTFLTYTAIGAGVWTVLLTLTGYLLGEHQEMLESYLRALTLTCIVSAAGLLAGYLLWYKHRKKRKKN